MEDLVIKEDTLGDGRLRRYIKEEAIERFHPNNINNKDFWTECRKNFPLLSVCGAPARTIKQVNYQTLNLSKNLGMIEFLNSVIDNSTEKPTVLEIGCGYGNLFFEIGKRCNYYGIDYVIDKSLKKYKNFTEINKSGIPCSLFNVNSFDIVYSVNVLQHCSQKDRFDYFQQSYDVLKIGGYLLFTEFLMTKENQNDTCWGVIDESERGYTQFFNQLTECDWDHELYDRLSNIGFKPIKSNIFSNFYSAIVQKQ